MPSPPRRGEREGPARVVIIADGWTRSVFFDLLCAGELPEIRYELVDGGVLLPSVVSIVPSVSIASHTTILTGANQNHHRIPGHRWFDLLDGTVRDYVGRRVLGVNSDISDDVTTIFEERSGNASAVQSLVRRGSARTMTLPTTNPGRLLDQGASLLRQFPLDDVVVWLPQGDIAAHRFGPDSEAARRDMRETSRAIGRFFKLIASVRPEPNVLLVPDHGHRLAKQQVDLESVVASATRSRVRQNSHRSAEVVLLTSGESAGYVYLPDRRQHSADSIAQVAMAICEADGVELVVHHIDDRQTVFFGKVGVSSSRVNPGFTEATYWIELGEDPLGLSSVPSTGSIGVDLTVPDLHSKYPDALHQLLTSYVEGRSGELLVLADRQSHFSKSPRLAWRMGRHRGTHGSLFEEEVVVAGAVRSNRPIPGAVDGAPIRSRDLLQLI